MSEPHPPYPPAPPTYPVQDPAAPQPYQQAQYQPTQYQPTQYQPTPVRRVLAEGAEYHMELTGPGQAWWRPVVSLLTVLVGFVALTIGFGVLIFVVLAIQQGGDLEALSTIDESDLRMDDPWIFALQNLMLAALIPLAGLTTWLVHRVRPGYLSSIVGRFRWGWAAWCALLLLPLWGGYIVAASIWMEGSAAGGGAGDGARRPEHWVILLVLMLVTTPLQSAGEEYLFRGWIMQQMGAAFRHRWAALVAAIIVSSGLFALAHGSLDVWVLLDLMGMATGMVILTWRTGGLEAAVVLHAINNLFAIGYATLFGDLAASFIGGDTTSDPVTTLVSWISVAVVVTALLLLARWRGVRRTVPGSAASSRA